MTVPPILDLFVAWHPDEPGGAERYKELLDHFHGPAYSGLVGGAVEVYSRSVPWEPGGSPRPLPPDDRSARAEFNVVVLVVGVELLTAVEAGGPWRKYIDHLLTAQASGTLVLPLIAPGLSVTGTYLAEAVLSGQSLGSSVWGDPGVLGREVAQAVTQWLLAEEGLTTRVSVFVSHSKHNSWLEDQARDGRHLYEAVRSEIESTRLDSFFDAHDIQAGEEWEKALDGAAASAAMLMVRTDTYSARPWTQREVLTAKRHDVPIVCMYAFTEGEQRGSFLMDHTPSIPCDLDEPRVGIARALGRLVDESLKRTLWMAQSRYLMEDGFDWTPVHAPEPVTLAPWLAAHKSDDPKDRAIWIIHPDPPLADRELAVVRELVTLAGFVARVEIHTPRTFAASGGELA